MEVIILDLDSKYSFVLDWDDLPEDVQSEKVAAVLRHWMDNDPDLFPDVPVDDWPDDLHIQNEAIDFIRSHFPIYF